MLGLGRALGETMAVAIILSPSDVITFDVISNQNPNTIAANIALQFPEAFGLETNRLIATGLVLFALTFAVNFLARRIAAAGFSGAAG
jgi:phosphate transport system permease protein